MVKATNVALKIKDQQTTIHEPNLALSLFLIKFYWNIGMLICLYIVYGLFYTTKAVEQLQHITKLRHP